MRGDFPHSIYKIEGIFKILGETSLEHKTLLTAHKHLYLCLTLLLWCKNNMEACLFLDDGYRGGRCENSFHICESTYSPCLNGAICVHGATYLDYTCKCREGKASVFVKVSKGAAKIRN